MVLLLLIIRQGVMQRAIIIQKRVIGAFVIGKIIRNTNGQDIKEKIKIYAPEYVV